MAEAIQSLLVAREVMKEELGERWIGFKEEIASRLAELARAKEEDWLFYLDELLDLCTEYPEVEELFRPIIALTGGAASGRQSSLEPAVSPVMTTERFVNRVGRAVEQWQQGGSLNVREGEVTPETTGDESETAGVGKSMADDVGEWPLESEDLMPLEEPRRAPQRVVNVGFAESEKPAEPVSPHSPLTPNLDYLFWLEVGEQIVGAIDVIPTDLPLDQMPPQAQLEVALFAFEGEIEVTPGADIGSIKITPKGKIRVVKQPALPEALLGDELLSRRLFFPVRTPQQPGSFRLRCHIYHKQTLVQSRFITVQVGDKSASSTNAALISQVDYSLSKTLDGRQLSGMGENRLSILINSNGNGTHGFRFFGRIEGDRTFEKHDVSLQEGVLQDMITTVRNALRMAAWGDEEPYRSDKTYRYDGVRNRSELQKDIVRLALLGYRFFVKLVPHLAGNVPEARSLQALMLRPGQVQVASKEAINLVIPAAVFYDYPLDDGLKTAEYSLCPSFLDSLDDEGALEETRCFRGRCRSYDDKTVICPSGFWGFRHRLGLPVSISTAPDAPATIPNPETPRMAMAVSTDPKFVRRVAHEKVLQELDLGWEYADSREEAIDMLKNTHAQVVYFYCHGGVHGRMPYLSLGPVHQDRFTPTTLWTEGIFWQEPRPLVFINGCHTAALEPEVALDLVSGFVETAQAAGVIGTEVTLFEPLATAFAESFFERFLRNGQTVGEAVQGARLNLLKAGDPLGLIYIPYVMPGLRLEKLQHD
jgi:hypothetical protein